MPKPEWRDREKEKRWRRLLRLWRRSGLTGKDFCVEHRLSLPNFYAWRREIASRDREERNPVQRASRRLRQERSTSRTLPAFMEVRLDAGGSASSAVEVVAANGRVLRVRPGFDAEVLRQLLRLVEEPAC